MQCKQEIETMRKDMYPDKDTSVTVHTADLADITALEEKMAPIFTNISSEEYARAILVNNAGSIGQIGMAQDLGRFSLEGIRRTVDVNMVASTWMTSRFASIFGGPAPKEGASTEEKSSGAPPSVVVQVSSLMAIQPFPTFGMYCMTKAGVDMFNQVLAAENSPEKLKVLNYAPGPMDTEMTKLMLDDDGMHEPTRKMMRTMRDENKMVPSDESAEKCVGIVLKNEFTSGAHIDFYD
mmetsp:Transcript_286/g.471  ORF Transcript_286/g.471 Transcript_286/m.471 type:complete len:237 (-) Transcript_286:240-950(-)